MSLKQALALEPTHSRSRSYGFTLLEVVIATAIAALALIGLFRAGTAEVFAVDAVKRVDEAIERAQSRLAAFGRTSAITAGETEGDDGRGYHWRLRARPVAQQTETTAQSGILTVLFDVEVEVSWRVGGHNRSIVLYTRRLGAGPATE
jgi:general secretion pathway protein I